MKNSVLFLGLSAMVALSSCTQSEVLEVAEQQAMSFDAFVGKQTKAGPVSNLNVKNSTFKVWGYKTKETSTVTVFDGQTVKYEDGAWGYYPVKYWDHQCTYDFYAISPASAVSEDDKNAGYVEEKEGEKVNKKIIVNDFSIAEQEDLMVATPITGHTPGEVVNLSFNHILTNVNFEVVKDENLAAGVKLLDASISLKGIQGDFILDYGIENTKGEWSVDESTTTAHEFNMTDAEKIVTKNASAIAGLTDLLMIPQTVKNCSLDITYSLDGEEFNRVVELGGEWNINQKYTYTLTINADIISFTTSVVNWDDTAASVNGAVTVGPKTTKITTIPVAPVE